ncbi:PKD domain-containing protein [Nocardioides daeguensis]|uniref:PKD domain-containing protein n=1 Tax=Nocardioides daeguensis TaxID=908359 RepID=A0ABP6WH84_9ACTN|nr:PKD domain-containing protein [Nocardioides daeguensis]MBV6729124.1 PKD domain-containing protein [Nocardioides daeguensis]MCR1774872.1 PKD domain-containing protein [Nocardioides daeguensis]
MRRHRQHRIRGAVVLLAAVVTAVTTLTTGGPPAIAQPAHQRLVPSAVPATTPNILDGRTLAIAEVGRKVFVGGTFTLAQNPGTSAQLPTPYLFAYDRLTGVVDPTFAPALDGSVNGIVATPDGSALFVAGTFKLAGTTKVRNIIKIDTGTGALVPGFKNPSPNGGVLDIALVGDRLLLAGSFTTVAGLPRPGTASLNAATGEVDEYLKVAVDTNHNWPSGTAKAPVGVAKIAASPDGTRLAAIGNFKHADGLERDQVVLIRLGPDNAFVDPDWKTLRYTPECSKNNFDSYVRDVDFSPDSSYFVVASSGAGYNGTLCDSAARFDVAATGQDVQPVWQAATGQDSLLSVAIADNAVYVGGHQKWMNAILSGADQQAGQVPRPGLAALDPANGMPLSWNPGRHPRGVGAEELLATDNGIYVGSDTEYIGNGEYRRARLAFFPVDGGSAPVNQADPVLPRSLYRLSGSAVTTRQFTGSSITAPTTVATTGGASWNNVRGAFMVGSKLVYGATDNKLHYRTFDGTAFGPDNVIDPYNDPYWSDVTTSGGTQTYRGRVPTLYPQISGITGMAYANHRLYYTRSLQSKVFWRWFSPDSMVVGAAEFTVTGSNLPLLQGPRGLVYADGALWAGMSTNQLWRLSVTDGVASGTWTRVTGDGIDASPVWSSGTMFLGPLANQPPTSSFTASCAGQSCSFDGSGSTDPDGTVTGWAWSFGDGATASGARAGHLYTAPGTYPVTLTVTDENGGTATSTQPVVIEGATSQVAYRDSTGKVTNATSVVTPIPTTAQAGDGLVAVVSAATSAVPPAPAGWTQVGAPVATNALTTVVWQKVAAADDAGRNVTVAFGATAVKATLTVLAYSGTDPARPVAAVAGAAEATATTAHRSPVVTTPGNWVVTVWADRSSATTTFAEPAGSTVRQRLIGAGGGHADQLVADTGGPVAAGQYGDQVATTDAAAKGTSVTIALR